jgi:hypothetical protein
MMVHVAVVMDVWKKCMLIIILVLLVMRLVYVLRSELISSFISVNSSTISVIDDIVAEMNIRIRDLEYENDSLNNLLLASQDELAQSNSTVD